MVKTKYQEKKRATKRHKRPIIAWRPKPGEAEKIARTNQYYRALQKVE